MNKRVFVLIPAYNAEKTIRQVFDRVPEDVRRKISNYIVVDDGSTDETQAVLRNIAEDFSNLVILKHQNNRGYGAALKTLLTYAVKDRGDISIVLHADGQYSPEKIPVLIRPLEKDEADVVQGSRMLGGEALKGGMPLYKFLANKCLTSIENWSFGMKLAEYHSGYMLYSLKTLSSIPFDRLSDSFDFDLEMIVLAKILSLRIKEISIPTIYADEVSYLNPIKYGLDVLGVVRKYRKGDYHALLGISR